MNRNLDYIKPAYATIMPKRHAQRVNNAKLSPRVGTQNEITQLVKNIKDIRQRLNEKHEVLKEFAMNLMHKAPPKAYNTARTKPLVMVPSITRHEEALNATTNLIILPSLETSYEKANIGVNMNATTSPKMAREVEQGDLVKTENEETRGQSRKKGKVELKLKKELQEIYTKIHKGQQDFLKASLSPRNTKILLQETAKMQWTEEKKPNVRVIDWINDTENTPKKDPPCFRRLAFGKAEVEKTFSSNREFCKNGIGDYIIGRQIGEGAYAVVKDGINRKTGEKVAIKIYDNSRLKGGHKARAVEREINLLKKMCHENVVGFSGSFRTPHHVYVMMEYIDGLNLRAYIRAKERKRMDENEAKDLFRQLVEGIAYCHNHEIAHRDIKLENVLVTKEGKIKIIDFGFSTCFPNTQKLKLFCGTPSYMAPEIVARKEYCGPPADIWAIGVLLYAVLTGTFPFKGVTDRELYRKIMCGKFQIPKFLSKEARDVLKLALTVNPDKRPTAQNLLQHPWLKQNKICFYGTSRSPITREGGLTARAGNEPIKRRPKGRTNSEIPATLLNLINNFLDEDTLLCIERLGYKRSEIMDQMKIPNSHIAILYSKLLREKAADSVETIDLHDFD